MWDRFTERAKHVISTAREEATRLGSEYVRTEHILLGLCREPDGIAARALENLGVDIESLAMEIEQQVQRGNAVPSSDEIAFTPRAKKVLELSVEEARRFNHSYIGTEHILLGLVKEGEGIAAKVLQDLKIDLEKIQAEVIRLLGDQGKPGPQASTSKKSQTPALDTFGRLCRRARRVIWLNPEYPAQWGSGDSDMLDYAPLCHAVYQTRSLSQLADAVDRILG